MKLLVVIPSLHRGGAERVVSMLSQEWAKDHEVKVAVFDGSNPAYAYGGELVDLRLSAKKGWLGKGVQAIRRVIRLAQLFREMKPDKVISFMESANFPCILAELFAGDRSRLWISVRNDPGRIPSFYLKFIPILYRMPDKVVAVSAGVAQALSAVGVPERKLISIPNPVPSHAPALSIQLPKPTAAPERYILGVGRLHWQKGFDLLLESFSQLSDKSVHLVILGEGNKRNALEAQASALGISHRVYMPGAKDDLWPWYRHALCFVLSSRHEGWPNVLMEAMSQGCPVIAFDCKYGPSEVIAENSNKINFLIPDGNVEEMTQVISNAIKLPPAYYSDQTMQQDGLSHLNINNLAGKWLKI